MRRKSSGESHFASSRFILSRSSNTEKVQLRWNLTFRDEPQLEKEFWDTYCCGETLVTNRVAILLALLVWNSFAITDYVVMSWENAVICWMIRLFGGTPP